MHCCQQRREIILTSSRLTTTGSAIITLVEAKAHLRVDGTDEDDLIQGIIDAVCAQAETYTGRTFIAGAFKTEFDFFPVRVTLDIMPIDITSIVVKYSDVDDATQTLNAAEYFVRNPGPNNFATVEFKGTIPNTFNKENAVWIEYNAGYSTYPAAVKVGILEQIGTLYENRQSEVAGISTMLIANGFTQMLFPYKML